MKKYHLFALAMVTGFIALCFIDQADGQATHLKKTLPPVHGNYQRLSQGSDARHIIFIADGALWAFGINDHGQLGNGSIVDNTTPTRIGTASNWANTACGFYHSLAIDKEGKLWAWGFNKNGQLGDTSTIENHIPTQIRIASNWVSVACGFGESLAISSDGKLWGWGYEKHSGFEYWYAGPNWNSNQLVKRVIRQVL